MPQRRYGQGPGGWAPPPDEPGFTWRAVQGTGGGGLTGGLTVWEPVPIPPSQGGPGSSGQSPSTTTPGTQFPSIPDFGLPDIQQITQALNQMQQQAFQAAEGSRIPGQAGLEAQSSGDIAALLNPGEYFPGTSREAAEVGSLRGVPGSSAADSTWVRMTDAERLARMGLGQQFLTAALGRHPIAPQFDPSGLANYLAQLPAERARLLTQQQQFAASQQQQRDLALAQMQNAFNLARLQALRAGSPSGGGYHPYGGGNFLPSPSPIAPRQIPGPPLPTPEGWGQTWSQPSEAPIGAWETPLNEGWDVPLDIPIDFEALAEPEDMYA